jgi:hypothetical protein
MSNAPAFKPQSEKELKTTRTLNTVATIGAGHALYATVPKEARSKIPGRKRLVELGWLNEPIEHPKKPLPPKVARLIPKAGTSAKIAAGAGTAGWLSLHGGELVGDVMARRSINNQLAQVQANKNKGKVNSVKKNDQSMISKASGYVSSNGHGKSIDAKNATAATLAVGSMPAADAIYHVNNKKAQNIRTATKQSYRKHMKQANAALDSTSGDYATNLETNAFHTRQARDELRAGWTRAAKVKGRGMVAAGATLATMAGAGAALHGSTVNKSFKEQPSRRDTYYVPGHGNVHGEVRSALTPVRERRRLRSDGRLLGAVAGGNVGLVALMRAGKGKRGLIGGALAGGYLGGEAAYRGNRYSPEFVPDKKHKLTNHSINPRTQMSVTQERALQHKANRAAIEHLEMARQQSRTVNKAYDGRDMSHLSTRERVKNNAGPLAVLGTGAGVVGYGAHQSVRSAQASRRSKEFADAGRGIVATGGPWKHAEQSFDEAIAHSNRAEKLKARGGKATAVGLSIYGSGMANNVRVARKRHAKYEERNGKAPVMKSDFVTRLRASQAQQDAKLSGKRHANANLVVGGVSGTGAGVMAGHYAAQRLGKSPKKLAVLGAGAGLAGGVGLSAIQNAQALGRHKALVSQMRSRGIDPTPLTNMSKAYRRFDPEADRQRRLGFYSGSAAGLSALAGREAIRNFDTKVVTGPKGKTVTHRGIYAKPGQGKKGLALGALTAGLGAVSAGSYKRGLSERNQPWT